MEDHELLRDYAQRHSEKAFTELVEHHLNMVYSTALRSVREPHLAKDIAQTVFISLARKPSSVRDPHLLAGWLYRATRFNAASALRTERRRREHENTAMQLNALEPDSSPSAWQSLAPHLDDAMEQLNPTDQTAVALRFFEGKSLREVGQALGMSDDAAQKRVSRALETLRSHFARRGIVTTSAVLISALSSQANASTPVGLATTVAATSLASAAAVGAGGVLTLINTIIMTKTKTALIAAVLVGAVAIPIISQRQENSRLRKEIVALRWEKAAWAQQQNQNPEITNATGNQNIAHPEIPEAPNRSIAELIAETAALLANSRGDDRAMIAEKWSKFLVQIPRGQIDKALLEIFKLPANEVRMGMTHVVFNMWTEENPRAALAFATVHFRGDELSRFASDALTKWAKQEPEAAFAAWREQSSDPTKRMAWGGNEERIVQALFEGMSNRIYKTR